MDAFREFIRGAFPYLGFYLLGVFTGMMLMVLRLASALRK